jgi:peptidoglycan/LPS O-acetylase OafA/YrhL
MKQATPSDRIILVDLIRSLSIVLVLTAHLGFARRSQGLDHAVRPIWNVLVQNGGYGVSLFFVLSGFLITRILVTASPSLDSIALPQFYFRRVGRILPLLSLMVLLGLIALITQGQRYDYFFLTGGTVHQLLLAIATFTFNWYDIWRQRVGPPIGHYWNVLWSLSVEEQFYVFYPIFLKKLGSLKKVALALIVVVVAGPLYRWEVYRIAPDDYFLSLCGSFGAFDQIALGALLFFLTRTTDSWMQRHKQAAAGILCAGMFVLITGYLRTNMFSGHDRILGPTILALGLFLVLWAGLSFEIKRSRGWILVCLPGELSYGMYLLHYAVLIVAWPFFRHPNPWMALVWFLLANTGVAFLSYTFFEKPANLWIRRR